MLPGFSHPTPDSPVVTVSRKLGAAEINAAIVHYYRGEVQRSNTWRNRLDTTTNWAVITTGATLSFAFTAPTNPHFVILINTVLVAFFLFMEARRYRYYEIWSSRVRMVETGYFAHILSPGSSLDKDWAERLAEDLITPHFTISEWEAVGRRLRRNYLWIFLLLAASWNLKVYLHPNPAVNFDDFVSRASVGLVPGSVVFVIGVIFNAVILIFALATVRLKEATGEVLPDHDFSLPSFSKMKDWSFRKRERRATVRRAKRARDRVRTSTSTMTGEWKRPEKEPAESGK
ncbi:MAG: DUF2270 domain-containing protein [Pyrinomonadaceae bacterium]